VIPVDNVLFASEMIGAVRGIDPETATITTTPALHRRGGDQRGRPPEDLRRQRAAVYPRLDAALKAQGR